MEKFSYNKIIANFHEAYNFLNKICQKDLCKNFFENYIKIIKVFFPVLPHLSSECLFQIEPSEQFTWPVVDKNYLKTNNYTIVIQINGKKRSVIETSEFLSEKDLLNIVRNKNEISKFLTNKNILKVIYVKNKILNLIVK